MASNTPAMMSLVSSYADDDADDDVVVPADTRQEQNQTASFMFSGDEDDHLDRKSTKSPEPQQLQHPTQYQSC